MAVAVGRGLVGHHRTLGGQLRKELRGHGLFGVRLILLLLGRIDEAFYFLVGRQDEAVFCGGVEGDHLIAVGNDFAGGAVHLVEGDGLAQLLHQPQLVVLGKHGLVFKKIVQAHVDKVAVARLVAVGIFVLGNAQLLGLGTVELGLGETVLAGTLTLADGGQYASPDVVDFQRGDHGKSVLGVAHEEGAVAHGGRHEGRVGQLGKVVQAVGEHGLDKRAHIGVAVILLAVALLARRGVALHVEGEIAGGLLLVGTGKDDEVLVVGNGEILAAGGVAGHGNGGKKLADFLLHLVNVDVAHHDDGLQVGAVPFVVIVAQGVVGEIVNHVHGAYGQAVLVFGALIDDGGGLFHESLHGHSRPPGAPFFVDDSALFVYFLVLEQQVVAPVVEDEQAGVGHAGLGDGCRRNVIDGLVNAGIGIEVGAELDAHTLAPLPQSRLFLGTGEMLGAVEGHVLQEMGQAALPRLLKDASHALGNVELGHAGRLRVVADVVGKAVLQLPFPDGRVLGQRLRYALRQ